VVRAVVQRVSEASVMVDSAVIGAIDHGLLVLLGIAQGDEERDAQLVADKVAGIRCFPDGDGKFNLSVQDTGGAVLVISQFTLLGDCRKGRRPSFSQAAPPETAIPLYESVLEHLRARSLKVEAGEFGAHMDVHLVNDGPVTLLIDTRKVF
jgi:D-tyrosyl-tRNA(Tyr) deacylase